MIYGHIYVKYEKIHKYTKIGSSKKYKNRLLGYRGYYGDYDDNTFKIWAFKIIKSKYDCYVLDKMIRILSNKVNYPYKYYYGTGRTEYYHFSGENSITYIEDFFKKCVMNM